MASGLDMNHSNGPALQANRKICHGSLCASRPNHNKMYIPQNWDTCDNCSFLEITGRPAQTPNSQQINTPTGVR